MFSIIVPAFNVTTTLRTCFDSVASQSFGDFELVLVDGASTDDTLDIAKSFAPRLGARLVIHSGPDDGAYDAMNRGVALATGTWLIFLGADDALYAPDTLTQVAAFLDGHDHSDLVYGDVIMRSNSSRYAGPFDLDRLLFEQNICHQAIFYRRELFAGIGPFNLRYPVWADWDFNIRCFSNPALVIRYMDIVIARYNDMAGISKRKDKELKKRLPSYFHWAAMEMTRRTLARLGRHIVGGWQARRTRSGRLHG
ncbi:glycosyltransferase family 2 protein [Mycobacterium sp. 1245805.9]|uniref:glycosyltransferase family 2 protein n=1 Tax=Mycobacterium sp. 1245805.9 TaxID=1856862 RepID=UPI0007FDAEC8|nr:glycosyltransferase family 2 protein [Mycobacterium sp. 1245805.9]OBI93934.1 glycosyltransferase [Mycobacterium sp. 1245805.9]